jgi:hypothetical protein
MLALRGTINAVVPSLHHVRRRSNVRSSIKQIQSEPQFLVSRPDGFVGSNCCFNITSLLLTESVVVVIEY